MKYNIVKCSYSYTTEGAVYWKIPLSFSSTEINEYTNFVINLQQKGLDLSKWPLQSVNGETQLTIPCANTSILKAIQEAYLGATSKSLTCISPDGKNIESLFVWECAFNFNSKDKIRRFLDKLDDMPDVLLTFLKNNNSTSLIKVTCDNQERLKQVKQIAQSVALQTKDETIPIIVNLEQVVTTFPQISNNNNSTAQVSCLSQSSNANRASDSIIFQLIVGEEGTNLSTKCDIELLNNKFYAHIDILDTFKSEQEQTIMEIRKLKLTYIPNIRSGKYTIELNNPINYITMLSYFAKLYHQKLRQRHVDVIASDAETKNAFKKFLEPLTSKTPELKKITEEIGRYRAYLTNSMLSKYKGNNALIVTVPFIDKKAPVISKETFKAWLKLPDCPVIMKSENEEYIDVICQDQYDFYLLNYVYKQIHGIAGLYLKNDMPKELPINRNDVEAIAPVKSMAIELPLIPPVIEANNVSSDDIYYEFKDYNIFEQCKHHLEINQIKFIYSKSQSFTENKYILTITKTEANKSSNWNITECFLEIMEELDREKKAHYIS